MAKKREIGHPEPTAASVHQSLSWVHQNIHVNPVCVASPSRMVMFDRFNLVCSILMHQDANVVSKSTIGGQT